MINVLLIDDNEADQRLVKELLKDYPDIRIRATQWPIEAFELIEKEKFDLVLTDLNMPGTEGDDMPSHIKKLSPETDVIAITGVEPFPLIDHVIKGDLTTELLLNIIYES